MRAFFLSVFLLFLAGTGAAACDFCNCLMGINPYYNSSDKIILKYMFQRSHQEPRSADSGAWHSKVVAPRDFMGVPPPQFMHGSGDADVATRETRQTFEIAYQHHFSNDVMATVIMPVVFLDVETDHHLSVRGVGDPMVLGHYIISDPFSPSLPATLLLGGGVKLPLGANGVTGDHGLPLDPRMQPGSGSLDLLLNSMMTLQAGEWMIALDLFGKLNTANGRNDRVGNSFSISSTVNRDIMRDNEAEFAVIGIAGLRGETAGKDTPHGVPDPMSGFTSAFGTVGGEIVSGSLKLDISVLVPLYQNRPAGSYTEQPRIVSGVRYEF